ncbi:MAG: 5-oxoprolinase subunit PxpB [Pseudomonadota bacterium]
MTDLTPRLLPYGDQALLVEFGNRVERAVSERILALNEEIAGSGLAGLRETVPAFRSLLVKFDPLETAFNEVAAAIEHLLSKTGSVAAEGRTFKVPVCYDGDYAPDLDDIAARVSLDREAVIEAHSSVTYHCYMIGFVAGCPYLGDMPEELALPRRTDPRTRIPDRSVAIAMRQTVIYPLVSPGGWHLIGKTPIRIFDLAWPEPALFKPGDRILFDRISASDFERIERELEANGGKLKPMTG